MKEVESDAGVGHVCVALLRAALLGRVAQKNLISLQMLTITHHCQPDSGFHYSTTLAVVFLTCDGSCWMPCLGPGSAP